jgi:hypothetical protein
VAFMSFRDDLQGYGFEMVFTQEQLAAVRPADVEKWTCQNIFGNPNPSPADNHTLGRFSSLEFYKKALSCYMVNRLSPWSEITQVGDPTLRLRLRCASVVRAGMYALKAGSGVKERACCA